MPGAPGALAWFRDRAFDFMTPEPTAAPQTGQVAVNERSVEVPWALGHLGDARRILDVGCATSAYLEDLGRDRRRAVYGLDPGEPRTVTGALVVRGTVVAPPFRQGSFDLILCISTVEHIGLPIYGQHEFPHGDVLAMRHMRRLLRPGGRLLLTVPFGRRQRNPWFRVYDPRRLRVLAVGFRKCSEGYFRLVPEEKGRYEACRPRALWRAAYDFDHMRAEGVACLELTPAAGLGFVVARVASRLLFAFERLTGKERPFLRRP